MELATFALYINFLHWYQSLFVFYWIVFQETDFTPKWVVLPCLQHYGTSFCTGSKILIWYSNQNKLVLLWLVMVWNLVLVSCKQSYTEPLKREWNSNLYYVNTPQVSVTRLNRQTWCPVVSPDFHGGWGPSWMVGEERHQKYKTFVELYLGIILYYILTISKSTKENQMLSEWSMLLYTS